VRTKRKMLYLLAAAVVSVPTAIALSTLSSASASPSLLPLSVTNNSGRAEQVQLYVIGEMGGRLGYVNATGTFTPWPAGSDTNPTPAPDVSIPGPARGASKTLQVPKGLSGRMYFSYGQKLVFKLTRTGLVQPAPWAAADPNRDILFDWSEFTFNDAGLWLNTSMVDMFSAPHAVTVTADNGTTRRTGDLVSNGRNRIFDSVRNQPGGWSKLIQTRADGTRLRVLSPHKGIDTGLFPTTYLDPYINSVWNTYKTTTLTVVPFENEPNRKFLGRVDAAGTMNFTDGAGARVASFRKPATKDVFGCDGALAAPNDPPFLIGAISRSICASFHRSTLGTIHTAPTYNAAEFYRGELTDHYSRTLHAHSVDGKAYGFAFDDVGHFESLVHDGNPRAAGIVLGAF